MTDESTLNFGNLPLIEAAVRASFSSPAAITYALINSVHDRIRPSFPALTEPQQLEIAPGTTASPVEFGPAYLPGAVYAGHTSGVTVHIQSQVVVARWSARPGVSEPKYPRYRELRDSLWTAVEAIRNACVDEFPGVSVVNMSYVNFIRARDPAAILKTYFSNDMQVRALDKAGQIRKLEAAWSQGDELDVRFSLEQGAAKFPDRVEQGYRLTTAAGLRLGESVDAKTGLERVHSALQQFFLTLISDHAKKEWQLQEHQA